MAQNDIADSQNASSNARDKLIDGLKTSINDAEKWLEDSADDISEAASEARVKFDDTLRTAITDLRKLEDSIIAHSREAAETVDVYVRDNPWKAVAAGAALGLLIGTLISRK
jgi:ElaB/YqjD/DUF883 family membrane-anchored ribosome-binding protein